MGSKTKTYHVKMLKYIARDPEVNVVLNSNKDIASVAVAGVIHQDTEQELGEVPDIEGYHQDEGVIRVELGEDLSEEKRRMLKELIRRYPDVFTDMAKEAFVIQHRVKPTDDIPT